MRQEEELHLSQEKYIEKVLKIFNMSKAKIVVTPFACHFKHSSAQAPTSEKEKEEIWSVIYASVVGSLIYAMVCIRLNIAHAVKVVDQFLFNL